MSTFTGMDIAAVRQLGAEEIRTVMTNLTTQIDSTQWVGTDRESFHSDWTSTHTAALTQVATSLEEASQRAALNADQQEQASAS